MTTRMIHSFSVSCYPVVTPFYFHPLSFDMIIHGSYHSSGDRGNSDAGQKIPNSTSHRFHRFISLLQLQAWPAESVLERAIG